MLNTIKSFIAAAEHVNKAATPDSDAAALDVMVTVDTVGGNRWIERGVLEMSPEDEADGVVRLYHRTYLLPAYPGRERAASLTRWPEHEVPTNEGTLTGLTDNPTFVRIERIVTLRYFYLGV